MALVDRSRGALPGTEVLTNLALVLRDRYLVTSDAHVLEDAVGVAERACATSDTVGPRIMLGDLLSLRHLITGTVDDLDRAVALLDGALAQLPDGEPQRPRAMVDLAVARSARRSGADAPVRSSATACATASAVRARVDATILL